MRVKKLILWSAIGLGAWWLWKRFKSSPNLATGDSSGLDNSAFSGGETIEGNPMRMGYF